MLLETASHRSLPFGGIGRFARDHRRPYTHQTRIPKITGLLRTYDRSGSWILQSSH